MAAYKWVVLSNTTIASLMAAIDSSIVLISLPTIIRELPGTGAGEGLWIIMGYLLVTSTLLLNFGRLGDMFGRVKMYNIGFAVFTIGSFLCSLSQTGLELVLFRLVQALGSAFLLANSAAIITDAFPTNERGRALGINQVAVVTGSVVGLVLGGILTGAFGWRSIFWVNIPIGIFGTVWAHYQLKEVTDIKKGQKLDILGNISFASGLTLLLLGITFGSLFAWNLLNASFIGFGAILLLSFLYIETKVPEPMFDLSLFRIRIFAMGNAALLAMALSRGAFTFMMVFYLQGVLGYDPITAGLLLVPMSLSIAVFGPISGWLSDKFGPSRFTIAGIVITGIAFVIMAQLQAYVSYIVLLIPLILMGSGVGLFASPNRSDTLSSVSASRRGVASGINSTFLNTSQLLSLGISVYLLSASVPPQVISSIFSGVGSAGTSVSDISGFMNGLHNTYNISALISFLGMVPTIFAYFVKGHSRTSIENIYPPSNEQTQADLVGTADAK